MTINTPTMTEQDRVVQLLALGKEGLAEAGRHLGSRDSERMTETAAYLTGLHGDLNHALLLLAALADTRPSVRRAVIEGLQRLLHPAAATRPVGTTYTGMPRPDRLPPNKQPWLVAFRTLLDDADPYLQARAAETLGWLDDQQALPRLHPLLNHENDVVRYYAFDAIRALTGHSWQFMDMRAMINRRAPVATVVRAERAGDAQTLSPFHLAPHLISQGKHQNLRGRSPRFQTQARLWWDDAGLHAEIRCDDPGAQEPRADSLTLYLQSPGDPFALHRLFISAEKGLVEWVFSAEYQAARPRRLDEHAQVRVERDATAWTATLRLAWAAFGRQQAPLNETWGLNIVRQESHGWRSQVSCWAHYYPVLTELPAMPRLGRILFMQDAPVVDVRPGTPERLTSGANHFTFALHKQSASAYRAMVRAYDGDDVVAESAQALSRQAAAEVGLTIPSGTQARSLDVEVAVSDAETGRDIYRACTIAVPIVTPIAHVKPYALKVVENETDLQRLPRSRPEDWVVRDHGPLLMTEYHPTTMTIGPDGVVYGGSFPGGRVYSYDPIRGQVRDLGSPCFPMNHTRSIHVRPDGTLIGAVNHCVFTIDPRTGATRDLGEPMPREPYSEMVLSALRGDVAWGCHQGHLFSIDPNTGRVVNKGIVDSDPLAPAAGERAGVRGKDSQQPAAQYNANSSTGSHPSPNLSPQRGEESIFFHKVLADADGCLLATIGEWEQARWKLARYRPEDDTLLVSDFEFEGQIFNGPGGRIFVLCKDSRLYRWEPRADQLVLQARYALGSIQSRFAALRSTGELLVARGSQRGGGIVNAGVFLFEPGEQAVVELGNPCPGLMQMVSIVTGPDDTVYGQAGTTEVYGLTGGPIHIYSVAQTFHH